MANYRDPKQTARIKRSVHLAAAKLFLQKGFAATTVKEIAREAGVSTSTMLYVHESKENILAALVAQILEQQFSVTEKLLRDIAHDKFLFYAAETTLQLYIVESHEHIRELYNTAYSLPKTTEVIQNTMSEKLEYVFREHLPHLQSQDFYELEIASCGIMRGFMSIPCDRYFTMERKIARFLETTFLIFRVSDDKIRELIQFVSQFDFHQLANRVVQSMREYLQAEPLWLNTKQEIH